MKSRWWLVVFILLGISLGPVIKNVPGFITINFEYARMQFPLWLGMFASFLIIILALFFYHVFLNTAKGIQIVTGRSSSQKDKSAIDQINYAVLCYFNSDLESMNKALIKSSKHPKLNFASHLLAARIAHLQGNQDRQKTCLSKAKKLSPSQENLVNLIEAEFLFKSKDYQQSYNKLKPLLSQKTKNKKLTTLLLEVSMKLEKWQDAYHFLLDTKKLKLQVLNLDEEIEIIVSTLEGLCTQNNFDVYNQFWKTMPSEYKKTTAIYIKYIEGLYQLDQKNLAEKLLIKSIKKDKQNEIILCYSRLIFPNILQQLNFIEKLQLNYNNDHDLLEALSNLALAAQLWGKARDYLELLVAIKPDVHTYIKLSTVMERLGDQHKADYYLHQIISAGENGYLTSCVD